MFSTFRLKCTGFPVCIYIYTRTMCASVTIKTWKIGRPQRFGGITWQTFSSSLFALVYLLLKCAYIFETYINSRGCKFYHFQKRTFQDTRRFLCCKSNFEEEKRFVSVSIVEVSSFFRQSDRLSCSTQCFRSKIVHSIIAPTSRQSLNFVKMHFAFCRTGITTGWPPSYY